jgi:hypothetical protein
MPSADCQDQPIGIGGESGAGSVVTVLGGKVVRAIRLLGCGIRVTPLQGGAGDRQ